MATGESQGRGSLVGCRLWGRTELDTTEATQLQQQQTHQEKKDETQIHKIRNGKGEVVSNTTEMQRITGDYYKKIIPQYNGQSWNCKTSKD